MLMCDYYSGGYSNTVAILLQSYGNSQKNPVGILLEMAMEILSHGNPDYKRDYKYSGSLLNRTASGVGILSRLSSSPD